MTIQKYIDIQNAHLHNLKNVNEEERSEIEKLLEKIENDDDVQNVFHNMNG